MKIYIINTEIIQQPNISDLKQFKRFEDRLISRIDSINSKYKDNLGNHVWFFHSIMNLLRQYKNKYYGYDETDKLLEYLIKEVIEKNSIYNYY